MTYLERLLRKTRLGVCERCPRMTGSHGNGTSPLFFGGPRPCRSVRPRARHAAAWARGHRTTHGHAVETTPATKPRPGSGFRSRRWTACSAALSANGWLSAIDAVVTGYLPSAEHAAFAVRMLDTVTRDAGRRPVYICDPVLGDLPHGLYIEEAAAVAIRTSLVPLADVLTPNAFELGWLSDLGPIASPRDAIQASRTLAAPHVIATSVPDSDAGRLANVLVTPRGAWLAHVPRQAGVPHGTGDVLTAQIAARCLPAREGALSAALVAHLGESVAATALIIGESLGSEELALLPTASLWAEPTPLPITEV